MSKDIWHKADEYNYSSIAFPEDAIVVDTGGGEYRAYSSFYDMPHHCDDPDCCFAETSCWKRWAKLDDLLALETELERTRKALDVAVEKAKALKELADIAGFSMFSAGCQDIIEQITAPEQNESSSVHNKIKFPEYNDNLLEEFDKQFFENGQDDDLTETALEQKDVK